MEKSRLAPAPAGRPGSDGGRGGRLTTMQCHLVAASGEFVGTFFFLYFAYAAHLMVNNQAGERAEDGGASSQTVVFVAVIYGFSLMINAWVFYRISGGLFNPAVALGLCLAGQLEWMRALFIVPAQLVACMCSGALVAAMFNGNTGGRSLSHVNTQLSPGTSVAQGLFIEMLMTSALVFAVLMLAAEKSRDTFIAPLGIGLALFVPMLAGVYTTGGSLNPARSLGCAVAGPRFETYHWIYWLGPALGAVLAAGYYRFVKWAHYEEANPGQDHDGLSPEVEVPPAEP